MTDARKTFDMLLEELRTVTHIAELAADEQGYASVHVDDAYVVNLQLVEKSREVLCFVEVADLPHDASKDVYRALLAGAHFGRETAGGYFALETATETVVYNRLFDLDEAAADVEDLVSRIQSALRLCDVWAERLHAIEAERATEDAPPDQFMLYV